MDSYSPVTHAAVVRSLLGVSPETPQGTIDPSYMFNMDSVSCLVGSGKNAKVRMAPQSTQDLQQFRRSAGQTANESKQRGVKQMYVTSADGRLLCAIITIRDKKVKNITIENVGNKRIFGYETWLILEPIGSNAKAAVEVVNIHITSQRGGSGDQDGEEEEVMPSDEELIETNDLLDVLDDLDLNNEDYSEEDRANALSMQLILMRLMLQDIIIPAMLEKREITVQQCKEFAHANYSSTNGQSAGSVSSSAERLSFRVASSAPSTPASTTGEPETETPRILLTMDGDYPQCTVILDLVARVTNPHKIEILKFPCCGSM